ncbi:Clan SC, family S9, unassigned serine peptidase [Histomonas meleagridis]|uniref:Clan SC, family S9, unassigned serine peptidase n=1 Tax=Histomonas meleagridis TaxID=135588 RepID=UPI0035593AF4|nr:Clan SC, family S9, unassigned serine peptidase [Histomonas meleagridis]KAH0802068.1 Clan SC, family S9, unassigned serine peptidase [Histomonas meleagridis]
MEKEQIQKEINEKSLLENANNAINAIVRPPRTDYLESDITPICFPGSISAIIPIPVTFLNRSKVKIVGTVYKSSTFLKEDRHRCVIYLHGNIGTQLEGRFLVRHLCPRGVSVFCFDFSGSGHSGGEYVTLGYREHTDILDSIEFLKTSFLYTDFVLWGRSMGASSAIMAAPLHPQIRGIIADSGYSSLNDLFSAIATQIQLPSFIKTVGIWWIKREVQSRAGFDCDLVNPLKSGQQSNVPLMLGHCIDDNFIPYEQGLNIFQNYLCKDKEMMTLEGGHNGRRDQGWIMKCIRFVLRVFELPFQYFEVEITPETIQHVASFLELLKSYQKSKQTDA